MAKKTSQLKVVIAAGGTGGHLFPAQALAQDLKQLKKEIEIAFLGANLSRNPYFDRPHFQSRDIASATPYKKRIFDGIRSLFSLQKGLMQALAFFRNFRPDVVIGFGSFYSFPTLLAAKLKRVPIILFESNVLPGRVNRYCSRWAKFSAVQFFVTQLQLKGKTMCVKMPLLQKCQSVSQEKARSYFGLHPDKLTFLVFGGSQGAQPINRFFCGALEKLIEKKVDFQVIHIVGSKPRAEKLRELYAQYDIPFCVKPFEKQMDFAWTAADLSISRSGSGTLAEQIEFGVPGILIPFPHGTDNHQALNATFIEEEIGGAIQLPEAHRSSADLVAIITDLLSSEREKLTLMKQALLKYKENENKDDLAQVILDMLPIH